VVGRGPVAGRHQLFLLPYADQLPAIPTFRAGLGLAYCEKGVLDEGREHFELLASGQFDLPFDWAWSTGMTLLVDTYTLLGDEARAHVLYDRLLPFAHQLVVVGLGQFCGDRCRGRSRCWARRRDGWDDAERHFKEALAVNQRIGARTFVVRTQRTLRPCCSSATGPATGHGPASSFSRHWRPRRIGMVLERSVSQLAASADCSSSL